jgi:hypothetical protein
MSRSPWLWFVLVGLVPATLLSGNVLGNSIMLAALFPAVAAMIAMTSDDQPQPLAGHGGKRLLVVIGVVAVLFGARVAWTGVEGLLYKALVAGIPAALAAWVLSGMYAPSPRVRRWVRSLVATGAPRRVFFVAVLAWPLVAAAAIAVSAALPGLSVGPPRLASAGLLGVVTVTGVFTAALSALAWYGFAARRLLPRLNPLVIGSLIGVVQWLVIWGHTMRPATVLAPFFIARLASLVAAGVTGTWACGRSRGSLLPVWLLGISLSVSEAVLFLTVIPEDVGRTDVPMGLFAAGQAAVALALVVAGRMWRSPARMPEPVASELSLL